jgi:hypothetical protein
LGLKRNHLATLKRPTDKPVNRQKRLTEKRRGKTDGDKNIKEKFFPVFFVVLGFVVVFVVKDSFALTQNFFYRKFHCNNF